QPCLEAGLVGQFGDGHGIGGDHGPPFRVDLLRAQRAQQQPRPADRDARGRGAGRLVLRFHGSTLAGPAYPPTSRERLRPHGVLNVRGTPRWGNLNNWSAAAPGDGGAPRLTGFTPLKGSWQRGDSGKAAAP